MLRAERAHLSPAGFIRNVTRDTVLASSARIAATSSERRRGLIGRESLPPGEGLVIGRCRQVHTFGMRFTIDVVFIDRAGVVVLARTIPPRRLSRVAWRARDAIELPAGTIQASATSRGDRITCDMIH